jgi:hypothetical protein
MLLLLLLSLDLCSNAADVVLDGLVDSLRSPFGPACGCYSAALRPYVESLLAVARKAGPANSKQKGLPHTSGPPAAGSLIPSLLCGHSVLGHPWPNTALGFGVLRRPTSCIHAVVEASCRSTHSATTPFGLLKGALSGRGFICLPRKRIGF